MPQIPSFKKCKSDENYEGNSEVQWELGIWDKTNKTDGNLHQLEEEGQDRTGGQEEGQLLAFYLASYFFTFS